MKAILFDGLFLIAAFLLGMWAGILKEQNKPPEPVIHHHLYYLDRSECKKPV